MGEWKLKSTSSCLTALQPKGKSSQYPTYNFGRLEIVLKGKIPNPTGNELC
jgi:hypothetical protein